MAMKPDILVLDEPAAGLDPEGRNSIFNAIDEYRRTENATVIIVSHSMEDMAVRCDKIAVLSKGKLLTVGDVDEVFSSPSLLLDAGLDVPEITMVASLLEKKGVSFGKPIYRVDDAVSALLPKLKGGETI
jgi:energy-coupling factor transport system ATP-binding protein